MNRIICDICGSEYPETDELCPICGYPRQGNEKTAVAAAAVSREKVKGGRFSSKNVKKRRKAQLRAENEESVKDPNKPLIITIIILLTAIILVTAYIALRFFQGRNGGSPVPQTTAPAASTRMPTVPPTVPCRSIVLETQVLDLETLGEQKQLGVQLQPADTTDTVTYVSEDPSVAAVSEDGLITAVGSGQTTITITCGAVSQSCTIVCWFQEETTLPPETTVPVETEPKATEPKATEPKATEPKEDNTAGLKLDPADASCFNVGEAFTIYVRMDGTTVSRSSVTWTTSDPKIATVDNGVVVAVGKGTATITAEYEGQKAACVVRCRFENPSSGDVDQDQVDQDQVDQEDQSSQTGQQDTSWKASHSDVTIAVGESFSLTVKNSAGETADAIWTMSVDGIVSIDGKTITGRAPGTMTLKTEVDGITFSCIVRVN